MAQSHIRCTIGELVGYICRSVEYSHWDRAMIYVFSGKTEALHIASLTCTSRCRVRRAHPPVWIERSPSVSVSIVKSEVDVDGLRGLVVKKLSSLNVV